MCFFHFCQTLPFHHQWFHHFIITYTLFVFIYCLVPCTRVSKLLYSGPYVGIWSGWWAHTAAHCSLLLFGFDEASTMFHTIYKPLNINAMQLYNKLLTFEDLCMWVEIINLQWKVAETIHYFIIYLTFTLNCRTKKE